MYVFWYGSYPIVAISFWENCKRGGTPKKPIHNPTPGKGLHTGNFSDQLGTCESGEMVRRSILEKKISQKEPWVCEKNCFAMTIQNFRWIFNSMLFLFYFRSNHHFFSRSLFPSFRTIEEGLEVSRISLIT